MKKKKLNEEKDRDIIQEWYKQAKQQTVETLPKFIKHLTEDYIHDYGTICHAVTAAGLAGMWAVDHSPEGGITGFQAGAIQWLFIREWTYKSNKCGLKLMDYDKMLFPQHESKFEKTIPPSIWEKIQKQARELLEENKKKSTEIKAASTVSKHWESIVNGEIPFGYKLSEE